MVRKILSKIVLVLLHCTAINPSNSFSTYIFQMYEEGKFCNWYVLSWDELHSERIFISELRLTQFLMHRLLWQELGLYRWTRFYSEVNKSGKVPLKVSCNPKPISVILSGILTVGKIGYCSFCIAFPFSHHHYLSPCSDSVLRWLRGPFSLNIPFISLLPAVRLSTNPGKVCIVKQCDIRPLI